MATKSRRILLSRDWCIDPPRPSTALFGTEVQLLQLYPRIILLWATGDFEQSSDGDGCVADGSNIATCKVTMSSDRLITANFAKGSEQFSTNFVNN